MFLYTEGSFLDDEVCSYITGHARRPAEGAVTAVSRPQRPSQGRAPRGRPGRLARLQKQHRWDVLTVQETDVLNQIVYHTAQLSGPLKPVSDDHGMIVPRSLMRAHKWSPMMPRDASVSDNGCKNFQSAHLFGWLDGETIS